MKKIFVTMTAVCLLALPIIGQDRLMDRSVNHNDDGSYSFETRDHNGNKVTVVVDPPARDAINDPRDNPDDPSFRGFEVEEGKYDVTDAVTIPVYAVADEEYRSAHSNWTSLLYQIIETADNSYIRDFGINWSIQGYYSWTSNGGNAEAILGDLASDGSGLPDGLCMGFSDDNNFNAGGIAYVYGSNPGTGYSVCLDQGTTSTTSALRHEIGHNYGCYHDFDPTVCLMNYTYSYSIDYFDSAHASLISSRTGWF